MKRLLLACVAVLACWVAAPASAQIAQFACDQNGNCGGADVMRMGATSKATITTTSQVASPAFNALTRVVLVACTVACHITQGASPATATTSHFLLPANTPLRLRINSGEGISVIRTSTDGTAYVVEMQ